MAKMNVTVDNDLDNVKLESTDKLKSNKKAEKKEKKQKSKKSSYLESVGQEMSKVTWPNKKDILKYSIATILMIVFLSVFFIGLTALFDLLYRLVQGWLN